MNKRILLLAAGLGTTLSAFAQLPVSTSPQNRKVVLEEFTGIHCQFCPDGHKLANELKAARPAGAVELVNIHTGGYATPSGSEPDYRTAEGAAIAAIPGMNIAGYPAGSINRHTFAGLTAMAINRGEWADYADTILAMPSYVNVALQGNLNVTTRVLTVDVQAYYTGTTTTPNNLTVVLEEDNVRGPQIDSGPFYPAMHNADGTYTHNHMLRKVLTAAATGEVITPTTTGTTISKTYTYTVPAQFVNNAAQLGNLKIIAFVAEGSTEIMTAAEGPITLSGFLYTNDMALNTVTSETEICKGILTPSVNVYNNGSNAITSATITYNVNGGANSTFNFAGSIAPATSKQIALQAINFTATTTNTLNVSVTNVNGSTDQNIANNLVTKSAILLTTKVAMDQNMTMNFTQDQFGSESSWKIYDQTTGSILAQDGPFSDLASATTQLHKKQFTINPNTCYQLEVLDEYGDGINAGTGAGKYELLSNGKVLISSNGQYGSGETKYYKSNATLTNLSVGTLSNNFSQVAVYPNPARDMTTVSFTLSQHAEVNITVLDAIGRVVTTAANQKFDAGKNKVIINTATMPSGLYNVRIQAENGITVEQLSVVK